MTDNRTTELLKDYAFVLRRLEYAVDKPGSNMTLGEYEAEEKRVTDEYAQAIAATLGSGTLTAEQVEKAIHDCSTYASYDGCTYYASGIRLQAIADELNAELGSGTCEMEYLDTFEEPKGDEYYLCRCSECGSQAWEPAHDLPRYCRKCGRKAVRI